MWLPSWAQVFEEHTGHAGDLHRVKLRSERRLPLARGELLQILDVDRLGHPPEAARHEGNEGHLVRVTGEDATVRAVQEVLDAPRVRPEHRLRHRESSGPSRHTERAACLSHEATAVERIEPAHSIGV